MAKPKRIKVGSFEVAFLQRARGEETPYFQAKVYRDGAEIGGASNDGRGGCTLCYPRTLTADLRALIAAETAAAGLPAEATAFEPEGIVFDYALFTGYERGMGKVSLRSYLRQYAAAMAGV